MAMKGPSDQDFIELVHPFEIASALCAVSALYHWNTSRDDFPSLHDILGYIVQKHEGPGWRPCPQKAAKRVLESARDLLIRQRKRELDSLESPREEGPRLSPSAELALMIQARATISYPGTPWRMLHHVLDKYEGPDSRLADTLGFTAGEIVGFALWMMGRVEDVFSRFEKRGAPFATGGTIHSSSGGGLLLPPNEFLDAWHKVASIDSDTLAHLERGGLNPRMVEFLSADVAEFGKGRPSVARYAFLCEPDGERTLLCPRDLPETLPGAIHRGILDVLPREERGPYGQRVGRVFQSLVKSTVRRRWNLEPEENVKRDENTTDADLVVRIPGIGSVLVECKGGGQNPPARWGDPTSLLKNIEATIWHGANQAHMALSTIPGVEDVRTTWIVTESYYPGLAMAVRSLPALQESLSKLPHPIAINYFQLDYFLLKIPPSQVLDFLDWRAGLLARGKLVMQDEFDAVRAFIQRDTDGPFKFARDRDATITMIGADDDYEQSTRVDLAERLGVKAAAEDLRQEGG